MKFLPAWLIGYKVITHDEARILEVGRQYLIRKRSEDSISILERGLSGVEL